MTTGSSHYQEERRASIMGLHAPTSDTWLKHSDFITGRILAAASKSFRAAAEVEKQLACEFADNRENRIPKIAVECDGS